MSMQCCGNKEWHKLADGVWHCVIPNPAGEGYYIDGVLHECEAVPDLGPRNWRERIVFMREYLRVDVENWWWGVRLRLGAAIMPEWDKEDER